MPPRNLLLPLRLMCVLCNCSRCRAVSKTAEGSQQQQEGCLQPGRLISYKKDDKHILALIEAADGKKNWWIVDQVRFPCTTGAIVPHGSCSSVQHVIRLQ